MVEHGIKDSVDVGVERFCGSILQPNRRVQIGRSYAYAGSVSEAASERIAIYGAAYFDQLRPYPVLSP